MELGLLQWRINKETNKREKVWRMGRNGDDVRLECEMVMRFEEEEVVMRWMESREIVALNPACKS